MFGSSTETSNFSFGSGTQPTKTAFGSSSGALGNFNSSIGMFGNQAQKRNGLFGSTAAPAPSNGGGLFGDSSASTTGMPSSFGSNGTSGLFGQTGNFSNSTPSTPFGSNKPATSGVGIFGNNAVTNSSTGLLGNSASTAPKTGGLFGNAAPPNSTSSGPFCGASTTNNQNSGGLSGNSGDIQGNTATSGVFFGNNNNTQASSSGGLFSNSNAPKPAAGGLFGSSTNPSFGSLFGQQSNNSTSNNLFSGGPSGQNKGGMFGGVPAAQPSGTLFGSDTNSNSKTSGLFGSGQQTSKANTGSHFGSNNTANMNTLFGGQQQAQNQPSQAPQLTAMMRFGDLPPDLKNELTLFDSYIHQQHLIATTLNADLKKHDILVKSIPSDVSFLHSKLSSIEQALRFDTDNLKSLKIVNDELTSDITNIMYLIVQLSSPGTKLSSFHLHDFFAKKIKKYKETMESYEAVINESVSAITGLEKACTGNHSNIYIIVDVVKNQYQLFMELCEVVAQLHNELIRIRPESFK